MVARLQHVGDHRINGRVLGPHVVSRPLILRRFASPVKILLVARRKRLVPAVLDHVEVEAEAALVEQDRVNGADRCFDARTLEVARIGERDALLIARGHQYLEDKGRFGHPIAQHRAIEIVAGLEKQVQRAAQGGAISA